MLRIPAIRGSKVQRIPWLPEERQVLRLAYGKLPTAEIARLLERSENAVGQQAVKLGLDAGRYWTAAEDRTLRRRYANEPTAAIASDMLRSLCSVNSRATSLGLSKSAAYLAGEYKQRQRHLAMTNEGMIAGRIKPGSVPHNKGKKMPPGWAPGRMAETQFKKGCMAGAAQHNYVPVGTLRVEAKDGYLERKVTDDHPVPARRWIAVHRLVWEAANGPIPAGHRVAFKPGAKTAVLAEITVEKLELVTAAEMMRRNTIHNYPPELKRAMQARGTLIRSINRATRGERHVGD